MSVFAAELQLLARKHREKLSAAARRRSRWDRVRDACSTALLFGVGALVALALGVFVLLEALLWPAALVACAWLLARAWA